MSASDAVAQLGPIAALAAAACVTTVLRLGHLVLCNDYRHPVVLAKELATLHTKSPQSMKVSLRQMRLGKLGEAFLQLTRLRQPLDRFAQVLRVRLRVRPRLGREHHARGCAHHAVRVGPQLEPAATRVLTSGMTRTPRDIAQIQLREPVIARQLRLDLALSVVHQQVIGASPVQFVAAKAG